MLVKFGVALVLLPLIVLGIGMVAHLVCSLILSVRLEAVRESMMVGMGDWLQQNAQILAVSPWARCGSRRSRPT